MHCCYEVHLVGYGETCLGIERNKFHILSTDAPLSEIYTPVETNDIGEARRAFLEQSLYLFSRPAPFTGHVKLEELKEETEMHLPCDACRHCVTQYPTIPPSISYHSNQFAGAWGGDVHIEGVFCSHLLKELRADDWIFLEYAHESGIEAVLTKHYAGVADCAEAYRLISAYVLERGGFVGRIYWETALGYCVVQC